MPIDTKSFGLSAAAAAAIVYSICSTFVALAPNGTTALLSYVFHLELTSMARPISWASYGVGVVTLSALIGLVFSLAAAFYNRLTRRSTAPSR
jgi:hypothetical protein